jgi:hypothetical protein
VQGVADDRKAEVQAWMAATGRGYKAAARHFGLPVDTVKTWGRSPSAKPSRAHAPAREAVPPVPAPAVEEPPADLTSADAVTYWRDRLRVALQAVGVALGAGHAGVAKDWERIAADHRERLDEALKAHRQDMERAERAAVRDPRELALRLLPELPKLLEVADDLNLAAEALAGVQRWMAVKAEGGA